MVLQCVLLTFYLKTGSLREVTWLMQLPGILIATGLRRTQHTSTVTPSNSSMLANLDPCGFNPEAWILAFLGYTFLGNLDLPVFETGFCFLSPRTRGIFWFFSNSELNLNFKNIKSFMKWNYSSL